MSGSRFAFFENFECKPRDKQPTEISIGPREEEINIDEIPSKVKIWL